jgi:uncharacterized protein YjbI with pentapeptide repeats
MLLVKLIGFKVTRVRVGAALAILGLAAGAGVISAGSAVAAASCPTVDPVTHSVTPPPQPAVQWSGCDLSGADLSSATLSNSDLAGANLTGANLASAALDTVNLNGADLAGATVTSADLDWADLTGANLTSADLHGAFLNWAKLTSSDIGGTDLGSSSLTALTTGGIIGTPSALPAGYSMADGYIIGPTVIMNGINLSGMNLAGIDLDGSAVQNADLSGTDLIGSNISGDNFTGSNLTVADLTNADLTGATLAGTDLTGATMDGVTSGGVVGTPKALPANWRLLGPNGYLAGPGANLAGASLANVMMWNLDLVGANLKGADLAGAQLGGADFSGADMSHTLLASTSIQGADLSGTNLTSADLSGVNLASTTLDSADFTGATLQDIASGGITGAPRALPANWALANGYLIGPTAALDGANLAFADLKGLDFDGAHLTNVDFSDANLTGASMNGVTIGHDIWLNTTCPDGTNSNLYTDGCFGKTPDTAPPSAAPVVSSGTQGIGGWYTSPVTVTWNWSDNGTVDTSQCTSTSTTTAQGNPVQLAATCTDLAGNQGSAKYAVRLDQTPPAVTVTGVASGRIYIAGKIPAPGCKTTDGLSGVGTPAKLKVTTTGSHGVGSFTATCAGAADGAGNRQAAPVSVTYKVVYGFGGFISPKPGSTIAKSAKTFAVTFRLTNAAGTPISATLASALAAANEVRVILRGPGISAVTAGCGWSSTKGWFRCVVKIPLGAETGSTKRYSVTAYENPGTGFLAAPPVGTTVNPEYIHFK